MTKPAVCLTFDVDWAPDPVLLDTLELLDEAGVKATFFATHKTSVLAGLDRSRYEIGIHPNFHPLLDGKGGPGYPEVFAEAMAMYDDVVGLRAHGLVCSGPLRYHAKGIGLVYESNMYVPAEVAPYRDYEGLVRIPAWWSDFRELLAKTPYRADDIVLPTRVDAVLAFHPIHVFLNSETPERYNSTRALTLEEKRAARHQGSPKGVRDFLVEFLRRVRREGLETITMRELAERHTQKHGTTVATHTHAERETS